MRGNLGAQHGKDRQPQGIEDEEEVAEIVHEEGHAHRDDGGGDDDDQIDGVFHPGQRWIRKHDIADGAAA